MFCTSCGTRLDDAARFCISCGNPTTARTAPGGPASAPAPRRLRRVLATKKISGVCSGFAEYFGMDITLMRLIWVALLLIPPNIGILAYIIAWAVLPKE